MSNKIPGGRINDETSKAYDAFIMYRDMEERSLRQLAQTLAEKEGGKPGAKQGQLEVWSSKYNWVKRCAEWDEYQDEIVRKNQLKEIQKMATEQARLGKLLQSKGAQKFEKISMKKMDTHAAIKAIVEGAKLERLARGEPETIGTQKIKVVFTTGKEDVEAEK